jgi:hypothetical protein
VSTSEFDLSSTWNEFSLETRDGRFESKARCITEPVARRECGKKMRILLPFFSSSDSTPSCAFPLSATAAPHARFSPASFSPSSNAS